MKVQPIQQRTLANPKWVNGGFPYLPVCSKSMCIGRALLAQANGRPHSTA